MHNKPDTKMRRIKISELRIHPIAQRRILQATLTRIINDLDLDAIGVIHVVQYPIDGDGALWVVDGQHRVAALKHHGLEDWVVDVQLHNEVKSNADASNLMLKLMDRASLNAYDKFRNELTAGNPVAVGTSAIVRAAGLKIHNQVRDGNVSAVSALKRVYSLDDGDSLRIALEVLTSAWGHTAAAVEGKLIEGVGAVYAKYNNGELDRDILVKKLAKFPGGPSNVLGTAKSLKGVQSGTLRRHVAAVVVSVYNKGRKTGKLKPI